MIWHLIFAVLFVNKFHRIIIFENDFYAKLGGITKKEINILEYQFLSLINFSLYISDEIYHKYDDFIKNEGQ